MRSDVAADRNAWNRSFDNRRKLLGICFLRARRNGTCGEGGRGSGGRREVSGLAQGAECGAVCSWEGTQSGPSPTACAHSPTVRRASNKRCDGSESPPPRIVFLLPGASCGTGGQKVVPQNCAAAIGGRRSYGLVAWLGCRNSGVDRRSFGRWCKRSTSFTVSRVRVQCSVVARGTTGRATECGKALQARLGRASGADASRTAGRVGEKETGITFRLRHARICGR